MSWDDIKKICFGALLIEPDKFYAYKLKELWLTLKGWSDAEMFKLIVQRKLTGILAETVNKTMGGKGAWDYVMSNFQLPHDKEEERIEWTKEKIDERIRLTNQNLLKRGFKIRNN